MPSELIVDLFVSVDGWAGSDGLPGYFGYLGPELGAWIAAEGAAPQVQLMGRRTYEMLAGMPAEAQDEGWEKMTEAEKVVFSRTLTKADWSNTTICADDLVDHVRVLKSSSAVPLRTVGSLSIARQLIDAGLVDQLRLMTFPLLAGHDGREAAFEGVGSADLALADHRVLDDRVLLVVYRPTGHDIPRA